MYNEMLDSTLVAIHSLLRDISLSLDGLMQEVRGNATIELKNAIEDAQLKTGALGGSIIYGGAYKSVALITTRLLEVRAQLQTIQHLVMDQFGGSGDAWYYVNTTKELLEASLETCKLYTQMKECG